MREGWERQERWALVSGRTAWNSRDTEVKCPGIKCLLTVTGVDRDCGHVRLQINQIEHVYWLMSRIKVDHKHTPRCLQLFWVVFVSFCWIFQCVYWRNIWFLIERSSVTASSTTSGHIHIWIHIHSSVSHLYLSTFWLQ